MMFWWGLLIGACIGTIFGVMIIALCQAAARCDAMIGKKDDTYFGQDVEKKKNNGFRRLNIKKDQDYIILLFCVFSRVGFQRSRIVAVVFVLL